MSEQAPIIALPSGAVLVQLSGELDLAVVASLRDHFASAIRLSPNLVVDMRNVEFLDCAGLGAFIWAANTACAEGGTIVLMAPSPPVRRLIDLAGVRDVLPLRPDLRAAVLATR